MSQSLKCFQKTDLFQKLLQDCSDAAKAPGCLAVAFGMGEQSKLSEAAVTSQSGEVTIEVPGLDDIRQSLLSIEKRLADLQQASTESTLGHGAAIGLNLPEAASVPETPAAGPDLAADSPAAEPAHEPAKGKSGKK